MELPSRLPSPWAHDSSPSPSPGPPPSPAYWMPHEWTPASRKDPMHARTLPHLPSIQGMPLRTDTTFSPLPSHPEFLRGLQSHPLIIQRGDDPLLISSPAPSIEFAHHAKVDDKLGGAVPFPLRSGLTTPDLSVNSRPLFGAGGSQSSSSSTASNGSSPPRTPDSAIKLPSSQPSKTPAAIPPPPPLPGRNSVQMQNRNSTPGKNAVAAPRPRLPALRGSTGPGSTALLGGRSQSTESTYPKHPHFYMQEGMTVLKVEGTLYRVHKYLLEQHSDFFRGLLSDEADAMGHSDDRPIPLPENITQQAFDCLLSFMYTGIYDPPSVPLSDWVTLLRLSTLLQFPKIRQYAIRELSTRRASLAPVDAIVIAKEHDISSWLRPAYADLVRRPTPLDDNEAERLGARVTAQVGRAREMLKAEEYSLHQQRRYGAKYALPEKADEQLVARTINEVFKLPESDA